MRKNHFLVTMCVLCLLSLFVMPVFSVDDATTLKMQITKLEAEAVNHQQVVADYEKQIKKYKDKCDELFRENSRLKLLCRRNGISTNIKARERGGSKNILREFCEPLEVGQIAQLGIPNRLSVIEIIDETNMIAKLVVHQGQGDKPRGSGPYRRRPLTYRSSFVDPRSLPSLPYIPPYIKNVWLKGIPTAGLVDLSSIQYYSPLEITGTTTHFGETMFVIEPAPTVPPPSKDGNGALDRDTLRRKKAQELKAAREAKINEQRRKAASRRPLR